LFNNIIIILKGGLIMRRKSDENEFEYSYRSISTKDFVRGLINEAAEKNKKDGRLSKTDNPYDDGLVNISIDDEVKKEKYTNFINGIKPMLLTSAIEKLLNKSCSKKCCDESYDVVKKNLVSNFVYENGSDKLLERFSTASLMLSEYAHIINKYYKRIVEETEYNDDNLNDYYIDPDTSSDFFEDLEDVDNDEVIMAVRNRVSDSVAQFINKNTEYKLDIQNVLADTQDKINNVETSDEYEEDEKEELEESYKAVCRQKINKIKNSKPSTVFERMVYKTSEDILKNKSMQEEYMVNNRINMDQVIESCELMYTLLELANTSKMINVDENYIKDLVSEL
jgi:hypothetical protein